MTTVLFTYYIGYGAAYWQAGAFQNELPFRVELGGRGATLAEVAAEFQRRTGSRVTFADPSLADLRVGGRFRADAFRGERAH